MKYKFEECLEKNLMSMDVINARRFARAVRNAIYDLEREAGCYGLYKEDYYLDTKAFLEQMVARLSAGTEERNNYVPSTLDEIIVNNQRFDEDFPLYWSNFSFDESE